MVYVSRWWLSEMCGFTWEHAKAIQAAGLYAFLNYHVPECSPRACVGPPDPSAEWYVCDAHADCSYENNWNVEDAQAAETAAERAEAAKYPEGTYRTALEPERVVPKMSLLALPVAS